MIHDFNVLTEQEFEFLKDSIALITVYIAGADGDIQLRETEWAEKVTKIRSYNNPEDLKEFYSQVGQNFNEKLGQYIEEFPSSPDTRNPIIEERLTRLNPILAKLPQELGAAMYNSLISFAKHVAKASGGFAGFFSIGPKEAALIELNMITPIYEEDEV